VRKGAVVRVRLVGLVMLVMPVMLAVLALGSVSGCAAQTPVERAAQLVRLHREGEAKATLQKHLAAHPHDIEAHRMLVRVLAWSGDLEGAKRQVAEIEKRLPNDPTAWIELGHAFELSHKFDEALAAYDTAASVAPQSPLGPREGGMRAARWGEPETALERLEEAVRRGARDADIFHALGLVRLNLKDYDGATTAYEEGLRVEPKSMENLLGLATVAVVKDDAAAALAAYERLLARKPDFAAGELGRAWALAKLGRKAEATKAIDRAEQLGAPATNVAKLRGLVRRGE
jgi:cytochrome c-type biogenesis protein CcmH/NrfG